MAEILKFPEDRIVRQPSERTPSHQLAMDGVQQLDSKVYASELVTLLFNNMAAVLKEDEFLDVDDPKLNRNLTCVKMLLEATLGDHFKLHHHGGTMLDMCCAMMLVAKSTNPNFFMLSAHNKYDLGVELEGSMKLTAGDDSKMFDVAALKDATASILQMDKDHVVDSE